MSKQQEDENIEEFTSGCVGLIIFALIIYFVFFRGCGSDSSNDNQISKIEWINVKNTSNKVLNDDNTLNLSNYETANGEEISISLSKDNEKLIAFSIKENGMTNSFSENHKTEFKFDRRTYDKETYVLHSSDMRNKNDTSIQYIATLIMEETGNIGLNSYGDLTGTIVNCILFVRSENYNKAFNFEYALDNLEEVFPKNDENDENDENKASVELDIFKNIDEVKTKLNSVGIGKFGDWKNFEVDWSAITRYYSFGSGSRQNNLAYYLSSENKNYIRRLKLVLNINNSSEKQQAIEKFKSVGEQTLRKLKLEIPNDLWDKVDSRKDFLLTSDKYSISVILEESNIDTWSLVIESK